MKFKRHSQLHSEWRTTLLFISVLCFQIEPLIQKGHENLVHHILLYQCDSNLNKSEINRGHECYHPNMPDSFFTCETVLFAWAIGGEVIIS